MSKRLIELAATEITKQAADHGLLLQAGWLAFQHLVLTPNSDASQVDQARLAFMAGAEHCYSSMMGMLDAGDDPTDRDMRRMGLLHDEAMAYRAKLALRVNPAQGTG